MFNKLLNWLVMRLIFWQMRLRHRKKNPNRRQNERTDRT